MRYMICYKLIRVLCDVIRDRLHEAAHRFLVIIRHAAISLHQYLLLITQPSNGVGGSGSRDDIKNIQAHGMQGFQIASIRAALVTFIAPLSVPGDATNLSHFLLFEAQSDPFFAQAFARTQLRDLTR